MQEAYKEVKTKSTYEASFYILYGGKFTNVRKMRLNSKRARNKGFVDMWTITVDNVPTWAIDTWRSGQAYGNIADFADVRIKLKEQIKNELGSNGYPR